MEAVKKARSVQRTLFTRSLNSFRQLCADTSVTNADRRRALKLLETRMSELEQISNKFSEILFNSEESPETIEREIEGQEEYRLKFLTAKDILESSQATHHGDALQEERSNIIRFDKPFKRPTLEIPKFCGNVSNWIKFWSHFKNIDEDVNISKEEKMEYLKQAVVKGSKAETVIEGYPTTAQNYDKAIEALKNRFGRKKLLIDYYVRQLLALALQNVNSREKKVSVISIFDKLSAHLRALETLGITTGDCSTMLYPLVESSLPEEILRTWQRSETAKREAESDDCLQHLLKFLQDEVEGEERIRQANEVFGASTESSDVKKDRIREIKEKPASTLRQIPTASALFINEVKRKICIFCGADHENATCDKIMKRDPDAVKNTVKEKNCCFKCLKPRHRAKDCKVRIVCDKCGRRHATIMCSTSIEKSTRAKNVDNEKECNVKEITLANFSKQPNVYMQTLRVILYSESREKVVRVLIDSGSQRSYIRSEVAEYLGYQVKGNTEMAHALFGGTSTKSIKHNIYVVRMRSLKADYACNFEALDQEIICQDIPTVKRAPWLNTLINFNISLSDIDGKGDPIDVLLGSDISGQLITGKKVNLNNGITAHETVLGWTIMGKNPASDGEDNVSSLITAIVHDSQIKNLWDLDVIGISDPAEKTTRKLREQYVKDNFLKTLKFTEDCRYSVQLPWVEDHAPVSHNLCLAKKRLETTVKRLKDEGIYEAYDKVFSEWLLENYIEKVPHNQLDVFAHYLPHRPVMKLEGTTKIRPVFDASASERGFPSLNDCLEKGPNLIDLIPAILLRFREREIAVIADIRKAFLQIEINERDRDYLRFLCFSNNELKTFRHKRVVFGLTCSPFLLGAVLEYHLSIAAVNARKNQNSRWSYENVEKLKRSFYVDNCITSVDTEDELKTFMSQGTEIMAEGNFYLRGWEFTHDEAIQEKTMVLGMVFDKRCDTIAINAVNLIVKLPTVITKRFILATTHKIFDPIGFTAPVSVVPKLLLKELWKQKTAWDTPVDKEISKKFLLWCEQLPYLENIAIDRKFGAGDYSIHTFCDASRFAYACVIFLRVEHKGVVQLKFLTAKTRVAPEKITTPRLELLAATIGSRQTQAIIDALNYEKVPVFYWSDSTTVLAWLNRDTQWGVFVWNRVREIRTITSAYGEWRYVPGELNPADLPSRGCLSRKLLESHWWEGPSWLKDNPSKWPNSKGEPDEIEINKEMRVHPRIIMIGIDDFMENIIARFSSYNKLIRFFTILIKFKNFKLKPNNITSKYLTYSEVKYSELKFLKYLQKNMFTSNEDERLKMLQIYTDNDGIFRLKTKIIAREDKFSFLFPILLSPEHKAIKLLIRETHETMGHAGIQTVMSHLRERYWILSMRKSVRAVINKCIACKRYSVKPMRTDAPHLPADRVKDTAVFSITGVDFAGPIFLRGRQKAWICLYTCAVYRAVHLELVSSLSTPEFLGSLRRFIGRRGRPSIIYSDNGSNFVGADNAFLNLNWKQIATYSSIKRIEWRFNPPTAAWWGGWWERLIGLLKNILRKILGKASLTYEEMLTVLCDCESILNSRPLTYVSEDAEDLKPLTPAMFLYEIRESGVTDLDILDTINLNSRFKYRQKIIQHLKNRFRKEYLGQLILGAKVIEKREIKLGDIVLVGNDNHKRSDWPLARVMELIVGRDGQPRVVVLKSKEGFFKRPIQRIYPLEVNTGESKLLRNACKESIQVKPHKNAEVNLPKTDTIPTPSDVLQPEVEDTPPLKTRYGRIVKQRKL